MNPELEIKNQMAEYKRTSPERYLAMFAVLNAIMDAESMTMPEGYSRGTFKRAVKILRIAQRSAEKEDPKCVPGFEAAIMLICRDWLHREADQ